MIFPFLHTYHYMLTFSWLNSYFNIAARFSKEKIAPLVRQMEQTQKVPDDIMKEIAELGVSIRVCSSKQGLIIALIITRYQNVYRFKVLLSILFATLFFILYPSRNNLTYTVYHINL